MAFQIKYSKKFQRMGVTATYRVDILSEAGGGVITPWKMGADPFQLKSLGAERDEDRIVIGSEIAFEFVLNKRSGESDYDPLFESEYREHIVKFYNDDTSTLLWQGYLQPENMSKSLFESNLHIYLSATDALKDLADFEFLDSGAIVSGRLSGLAILKLCLTNLDQASQFQYSFYVKLGTKHTGQGVNDTALKDVTHDTRRFSKVEDGKTEVDNCLEVIEKVLRPYSCQLFQWGGKYYIKNRHEAATNYYVYNWALAFQSKAASSDVVNIDTYKFRRDADVSLLPPVKEIGLKLLNRNTGDELVSDINDFSGVGPWDFTGFPGGDVIDEDPNLHIELKDTNEANDRTITLSSDVTLTKVTDNDYIKLQFQHNSHVVVPPTYTPTFVITITKPSGNYDTWEETMLLDYWKIYESPNNETFRVTETGDYNITITFTHSIAATPPYTEDVYLRNLSLTKIISIDETTYSDISFDVFYRAISDVGKKINPPVDVYFGDTAGTNDLAALYYSGSNTDEWDREGVSDDLPLLHIYALNYLTNRKAYGKYIIITVKDASDNITPVNYATFDSENYDIVSFDKSYRTSWVTLHLKQRLTGDVTMSFNETIMSSVDGASTTQTLTVVSTGGPTSMVYPGIGIANSTGSAWGTSYTTSGTGTVIALTASPTLTGSPAITGNLVFNDDATERFIRSSVNGGAIRIRGNSSSATDRGIKIGQVDNTGAWVNTWIEVPADTGDAIFSGTPLFNADADFASNINFNNDATERFIKSSVAGGAMRIRGNGLATTDRGLKLGVVDNGGTFYQHINIEEGVSAAIGNIGITGGLHVGGTADPGDNNLWIDGIAQEPNFNSGWQGTNWQIQADGDAEFNNVLIRGGLSVFELIINQLHYQNGGLIIGAGAGKVEAISDATVGAEVMTFQDPEGNSMVPFSEGAIVMIQRVDINRTDVVKKIVRQVDDITGMDVTMTSTAGWTPGDPAGDDTGIFEVGDEVVAIGHISDTDLDSCLYMSAIDSGNPFLRVMDGVSTYGKFSLGDKTTIKLQLGNLASLASYDILPASPGYGLYSDNAYLSGRIVLPSAGMTNEGSSGTDIRIWAGDSYANRATAPFRVDQDGSLTAVGVAELGTNTQNYGGSDDWNVAIKGADIWENAREANSSTIQINRIGFNGGTDYYRDFQVYDGKGHKIFGIGSSAAPIATFGNAVTPTDVHVIVNGVLTMIPRTVPTPFTAQEGMILADSNNHHLYYYNGSAWKQLDN